MLPTSERISKIHILWAVFLVLALLLAGCSDCGQCGSSQDKSIFQWLSFRRTVRGSGVSVELERDLGDFSEVVLSEEGDLFIETGEQERLVIEAEDNLQEFLVADIQHGILDIKKWPEKTQLQATKPIRYYLTVRSLEGLTIKNSGDAVVTRVASDHFQVRVTGSGSVRIASLNAQQLDIELTSSGNLTIEDGQVVVQNIRLSSSGNYLGSSLISKIARVGVSSSGEARIYVLDKLEIDLSSSGNVYYIGDPILLVDSSSSGRAMKMP